MMLSTSTLRVRVSRWWTKTLRVLRRHALFVGPGILASVAYADPGNWATDLQAGSQYGYALLFIVLLTGIFAVFIQILSCRVGVVTNADLARQCRMLILKENRFGNPTQTTISWPRLRRWGLLYPLYVICEGAIVATELAELTGSAIALNLLFPGLPLWAGILITSVDVILILFVYKPPPNGSFRLLEALIALLVFTVLACFIVILVRIKPVWADVFHGYLPSHAVVGSGALYVSVGILGATVMPHAIILGSHFASIDRLPNLDAQKQQQRGDDTATSQPPDESWWSAIAASLRRTLSPKEEAKSEPIRLSRAFRSLVSQRTNLPTAGDDASSVNEQQQQQRSSSAFPEEDLSPRTLENIRIHLKHASVDIGISLVSLAIVINSAILIVAAAAFYYTPSNTPGSVVVASLYDAFYLLKDRLGSLAAVLFAVALLAAGQSASITVTLAGQLVSEGFINWRTNPFLRRVVTRLVAVVPSLTVSLAVGKDGLDEMLVASQVALSIALPFVLLPLILVTGSKPRMTATEDKVETVASESSSARSSLQVARSERNRVADVDADGAIEMLAAQEDTPAQENGKNQSSAAMPTPSPSQEVVPVLSPETQQQGASPSTKSQCFASAWYVQVVAYAIFAVIVVADGYVLVTTFMGDQ